MSEDMFGNRGEASISVLLDTEDPKVDFAYDFDGLITRASAQPLIFDVGDTTDTTSTVNGVEIIAAGPRITTATSLVEGANVVDITTTDALGHESSVDIEVVRDTISPVLEALMLDNTPVSCGDTVSHARLRSLLSATVGDASAGIASRTGIHVIVNAAERWRADPGLPHTLYENIVVNQSIDLVLGSNTVVIHVTDRTGNRSSCEFSVWVKPKAFSVLRSDDQRIAAAQVVMPNRVSPPTPVQVTVEEGIARGDLLTTSSGARQSAGYAVRFHVAGDDSFVFGSPNDGECAQLVVPYDPEFLESSGSRRPENSVRLFRLANEVDCRSGEPPVFDEVDSPLAIDTLRNTVAVCSHNVSVYVLAVDEAPPLGAITEAWLVNNGTSAAADSTLTPADLATMTLLGAQHELVLPQEATDGYEVTASFADSVALVPGGRYAALVQHNIEAIDGPQPAVRERDVLFVVDLVNATLAARLRIASNMESVHILAVEPSDDGTGLLVAASTGGHDRDVDGIHWVDLEEQLQSGIFAELPSTLLIPIHLGEHADIEVAGDAVFIRGAPDASTYLMASDVVRPNLGSLCTNVVQRSIDQLRARRSRLATLTYGPFFGFELTGLGQFEEFLDGPCVYVDDDLMLNDVTYDCEFSYYQKPLWCYPGLTQSGPADISTTGAEPSFYDIRRDPHLHSNLLYDPPVSPSLLPGPWSLTNCSLEESRLGMGLSARGRRRIFGEPGDPPVAEYADGPAVRRNGGGPDWSEVPGAGSPAWLEGDQFDLPSLVAGAGQILSFSLSEARGGAPRSEWLHSEPLTFAALDWDPSPSYTYKEVRSLPVFHPNSRLVATQDALWLTASPFDFTSGNELQVVAYSIDSIAKAGGAIARPDVQPVLARIPRESLQGNPTYPSWPQFAPWADEYTQWRHYRRNADVDRSSRVGRSGLTVTPAGHAVVVFPTGEIRGMGNPVYREDSSGGACVPDCAGKTCGFDGCGGSCGTCGAGEACYDYQCEPSWTDYGRIPAYQDLAGWPPCDPNQTDPSQPDFCGPGLPAADTRYTSALASTTILEAGSPVDVVLIAAVVDDGTLGAVQPQSVLLSTRPGGFGPTDPFITTKDHGIRFDAHGHYALDPFVAVIDPTSPFAQAPPILFSDTGDIAGANHVVYVEPNEALSRTIGIEPNTNLNINGLRIFVVDDSTGARFESPNLPHEILVRNYTPLAGTLLLIENVSGVPRLYYRDGQEVNTLPDGSTQLVDRFEEVNLSIGAYPVLLPNVGLATPCRLGTRWVDLCLTGIDLSPVGPNTGPRTFAADIVAGPPSSQTLVGNGRGVAISHVSDGLTYYLCSSPSEPEDCDGLDNDCDGQIDEDLDLDGDGWRTCLNGSGDCDDTPGSGVSVNPGAPELCANDIDDDCDGDKDFDDDDFISAANYGEDFVSIDADDDGVDGCQMILDWVERGDLDPADTATVSFWWMGLAGAGLADCDDDDATAYGGAPLTCTARPNGATVHNDCSLADRTTTNVWTCDPTPPSDCGQADCCLENRTVAELCDPIGGPAALLSLCTDRTPSPFDFPQDCLLIDTGDLARPPGTHMLLPSEIEDAMSDASMLAPATSALLACRRPPATEPTTELHPVASVAGYSGLDKGDGTVFPLTGTVTASVCEARDGEHGSTRLWPSDVWSLAGGVVVSSQDFVPIDIAGVDNLDIDIDTVRNLGLRLAGIDDVIAEQLAPYLNSPKLEDAGLVSARAYRAPWAWFWTYSDSYAVLVGPGGPLVPLCGCSDPDAPFPPTAGVEDLGMRGDSGGTFRIGIGDGAPRFGGHITGEGVNGPMRGDVPFFCGLQTPNIPDEWFAPENHVIVVDARLHAIAHEGPFTFDVNPWLKFYLHPRVLPFPADNVASAVGYPDLELWGWSVSIEQTPPIGDIIIGILDPPSEEVGAGQCLSDFQCNGRGEHELCIESTASCHERARPCETDPDCDDNEACVDTGTFRRQLRYPDWSTRCCAAGDPCGLANNGTCDCQSAQPWDIADCAASYFPYVHCAANPPSPPSCGSPYECQNNFCGTSRFCLRLGAACRDDADCGSGSAFCDAPVNADHIDDSPESGEKNLHLYTGACVSPGLGATRCPSCTANEICFGGYCFPEAACTAHSGCAFGEGCMPAFRALREENSTVICAVDEDCWSRVPWAGSNCVDRVCGTVQEHCVPVAVRCDDNAFGSCPGGICRENICLSMPSGTCPGPRTGDNCNLSPRDCDMACADSQMCLSGLCYATGNACLAGWTEQVTNPQGQSEEVVHSRGTEVDCNWPNAFCAQPETEAGICIARDFACDDDPNTGFRPPPKDPGLWLYESALGQFFEFAPPDPLEVQCNFGRVCLEHPNPGFDHHRCVSPCAERHPDGQATRLTVVACKTGDEIRDAFERELRQATIDSSVPLPVRSVFSQIADLFTHPWFTLSPTNPVDFRDSPPTAVFGVCPDRRNAFGTSFPAGGINDTCDYEP